MSPLVIRSATSADRAAVIELDALLGAPGEAMELPALSEEEIDGIGLNGRAMGIHLLVAEQEDAIVGFVLAMLRAVEGGNIDYSSTVMLLRRMAVSPAVRRGGIGSALLDELENRIARDPRSMLQAHVPTASIPFYEAQGWTVLEPDLALAWVEVPTLKGWDAAIAAGFDAGPRRKMTFLRTEDPSADEDMNYNRVAFKVLRPDLIVEHFGFEFAGAPSSLFAAMRVIAVESINDPARFKRLPPDVSRQVYDMALVPLFGRERADQVRRGR